MSEPEDILSDAIRHAYVGAKKLWRRKGDNLGEEGLGQSRRRLELFLAAAFPRQLEVRIAQPPAPPSFLRILFGAPRRLLHREAIPGTDGRSVFLPERPVSATIPTERLLRLLALQQGQRALRGSAAPRCIPAGALARALYELAEAEEADRWIRRELPGLRGDLDALRLELLEARAGRIEEPGGWPEPEGGRSPMARGERAPSGRHVGVGGHVSGPKGGLRSLSALELRFEALYREVLRGGEALPTFSTPEATSAWAADSAKEWKEKTPSPFRAFLRDLFIGSLREEEALRQVATFAEETPRDRDEQAPQRSNTLQRRPEVREDEEGEDESEAGPWMLQMEDPHEHVEDPMGLQRPTDRGDDGEGAADAMSELPEARIVSTPQRAEEVFVTDDPPQVRGARGGGSGGRGIVYPEWDHKLGAYRPAGATVWVEERALGPADWADEVRQKRRLLFEQVRRRFEALRSRMISLGRQLDGEELDLDALVEFQADRLAGLPSDERLYRQTRQLRRDLAIFLLVDVSGSTDAWIGEDQRIVDVEKEAVLLCLHALEALGDPYAIEAFSGEGAHGVRHWQVKGFEERERTAAERRIADLEPDNYTRAGAALRHATASLAARGEEHRLLLLLSDGKPNDQDEYGGKYGVEDMRQAVQEALGAGISVFCLTVDREAPLYLPRIFGPGRSTTLPHASHLPVALVEVLRHLIRR